MKPPKIQTETPNFIRFFHVESQFVRRCRSVPSMAQNISIKMLSLEEMICVFDELWWILMDCKDKYPSIQIGVCWIFWIPEGQRRGPWVISSPWLNIFNAGNRFQKPIVFELSKNQATTANFKWQHLAHEKKWVNTSVTWIFSLWPWIRATLTTMLFRILHFCSHERRHDVVIFPMSVTFF